MEPTPIQSTRRTMDEGAAAGSRKKGLWTEEEDRILMEYIRVHGKGKWNQVAKMTGLKRCGKSCRLRWINYLSPSVKRDTFSEEEDDLIIRLHKLLGNRWSLIAGRVPGRTDNQVKNHWNTHLSKKLGIQKGKCKVSKGNSKFIPSTSNNTPTSINDRKEKAAFVDHGLQTGISKSCGMEITTIQGIAPTHWDDTSFLFLDDYPNLYSPINLFHLLHRDSLDFLV